jgi:hypothetical protein
MIQFGGNIGAACEERIDIVWKSARRSTSEEMAHQPDLDARSAAALTAALPISSRPWRPLKAPVTAMLGPASRLQCRRLQCIEMQTEGQATARTTGDALQYRLSVPGGAATGAVTKEILERHGSGSAVTTVYLLRGGAGAYY